MFLRNQLGNKVLFTSLGCSRNLVDTEVMLGILLKAGYEVAESVEEADYIVVNTCGFLESARKESCDTIDALMNQKKAAAKMIVAGCMVSKHKDVLQENFPAVHYYLGSGDMEKILEAVEADNPGEAISKAKSYLENGEVPRQVSTPKHYAYLKIAEGCAKACSYCIIPKIKGGLRSKTHEQVLKEFNILLDQGAKEIILIAQDLGDYGKDRGEKQGFEVLAKRLLEEKRDFWLRFLYLYPDEITDELIQIMKNDPRVCPYLDMPIQHINNDVLKSMKRKTSKEQIIDVITKLRKEIPDVVIRTSLMVGFPGETEEQFEELVQFIQDHPIDNIGIFKYSKEKESHSATLPGHIDEEVKERRYHKLMQTQLKMVRKINKKYIGKTLQVMLEGYHPETELLLRGRFYGQCPEIDGQVVINDAANAKAFGMLHDVKITDVMDYDLIGKIIGPSKKNGAPNRKSLKLA